MASYNELNALIDAYINRNGVQAITGQILNGVLKAMVQQIGRGYAIMGVADPTTDPWTPDAPESWFAYEPGTYTLFDGITVAPGEFVLLEYRPNIGWRKETLYDGFQTVQASIDGGVGTPSVGVSYANGVLSFDFHNMKGNPGEPGKDGYAAGFGTIGADITGGVGTPGVSVESSGPATAKNLQFHFTNLKGETGVTSVMVTVDNTTGTPTCTASLSGGVLTLAFTGLKGAQGDTGSSVDYPFTIVNNLTTNDATQALSAAMGVELAGQVSQLEHKVDDVERLNGRFSDNSVDLDIADENGNVIMVLSDGHIKTKNFDSSSPEQFQPDWDENDNTKKDYIKNKPTLSSVATSGDYEDLSNKPDIPVSEFPNEDTDLDLSDESGNVVAEFAGGHIRTKNFDSRYIVKEIHKVHLSFDDTEYCIASLYGGEYSSVWDEPFFAWLKNLHETNGMTFTLLLFVSTFASITNAFATELGAASGWLKFSLHGDKSNTYPTRTTIGQDWADMVSAVITMTGNPDSIDRHTRLSSFSASEENVQTIRDAKFGCIALSASEMEDRLSYYLDADEQKCVYNSEYFFDSKNNIYFIRTFTRFDGYDWHHLEESATTFIEERDFAEFFIHEYDVFDNSFSWVQRGKTCVEDFCDFCHTNKYEGDFYKNIIKR